MPVNLYNSISSLVPITEEEYQLINSVSVLRSFQKDDFICREGEICRYTNFIESGSVRAYHIDANGQEQVIQLGINGWWISDFSSFINQQPGLLQVQSLEPTLLRSFTFEAVHSLFDKLPVFERFYRLLVQRAYTSFQQRVLENLSLDAEKRYLQFRAFYPDLNNQILQKHIASYLGMSAEFLSKIKKRVYQADKRKAAAGRT